MHFLKANNVKDVTWIGAIQGRAIWVENSLPRHDQPVCCNPSFGFATKAKGLQGCGPRESPGVKAKRLQGSGPRGSPGAKARGSLGIKPGGSQGVTSHTPGSVRKCEGVWGNEHSHSQGNSDFGRWSPGGLLKLQRAIAGVKTQWLVALFISLESSWSVDV